MNLPWKGSRSMIIMMMPLLTSQKTPDRNHQSDNEKNELEKFKGNVHPKKRTQEFIPNRFPEYLFKNIPEYLFKNISEYLFEKVEKLINYRR